MLDQLPDVVLINFFHHLPYGDKIRMEKVCRRFKNLMQEIWNKKRTIVFPFDIWQINDRYALSSYLDDFSPEMGILIGKCPNLSELHFQDYKRIQIFIQSSCARYFEKYGSLNLSIREIFIGSKYVTDLEMIREMARVFPNLETLTVQCPYPLLHEIRSDTMTVIRERIRNVEPQLGVLMEDNERVIEDIRLYLELFSHLKKLILKRASFDVVNFEGGEF